MEEIVERKPFETLDPEGKAEWKKCYERVLEVAAEKEVGGDGIIRYEEIAAILGRPLDDDNQRLCQPMQRVKVEVQKVNGFAIRVEPKVGYRIIEPKEHLDLARHHHRKTRRQVGKVELAIKSADKSRLTDRERFELDALENRRSRIAQAVRKRLPRVSWGSD